MPSDHQYGLDSAVISEGRIWPSFAFVRLSKNRPKNSRAARAYQKRPVLQQRFHGLTQEGDESWKAAKGANVSCRIISAHTFYKTGVSLLLQNASCDPESFLRVVFLTSD